MLFPWPAYHSGARCYHIKCKWNTYAGRLGHTFLHIWPCALIITLITGEPRGCVLSSFLYSLSTHDCRPVHRSNIIIKFRDDTTVIGVISNNDEAAYREDVQHLTRWCADNNLFGILEINLWIHCGLQKSERRHAWPHSHQREGRQTCLQVSGDPHLREPVLDNKHLQPY